MSSFLFLGGDAPACLEAADANDDGALGVTDVLGILTRLFQGNPQGIAAPYPGKGFDPTFDDLPCNS